MPRKRSFWMHSVLLTVIAGALIAETPSSTVTALARSFGYAIPGVSSVPSSVHKHEMSGRAGRDNCATSSHLSRHAHG
jgi:hypothetical protein